MRPPTAAVDHGAPLSRPAPFSPVSSSDQVRLTVHQLSADRPGTRPILLAHATGFHGLVWAPLARHLDGFTAYAARSAGPR